MLVFLSPLRSIGGLTFCRDALLDVISLRRMRPRKILERLPMRIGIGKRFCDQPAYGVIGKIMARKAVQGGFMPVPQLATASITDRIQALDGRESVPPFELKSIERDIERLKGVSAAEAYMLSGMLSAALGDYEDSKESHQRSLRLAMDDVGLVNYAISLRKLGRLREAKVHFLKALERSPGSVHILEKVVRTCVFLCDYEDFEEVIAKFTKANPESFIEDMQCMENARSIVSHLERLNIPFSEFKVVGEFIEQTMIEFGLVANNMHERLGNFDGVQHVYIEIPLAVKSAHQLVAINDRVAELVLGCDEITSWDRLVVNFTDERSAPTSAVA